MNVAEMQRKLSLKAEREPNHKFDDLFNLLVNRTWLKQAHDSVAKNAGSVTAGCDGITMRVFDEKLDANIDRIIRELKQGTFEPLPVRRVNIPKSNGKARPLGIPSIQDRIVQEALRMVLEPIYEADFCQDSFGFRPNRCTMDAISRIYKMTTEQHKYFWVIEGDISSYFDSIKHRKLMKLLRRRIADEKLLTLLWRFLRAGVMEGKLFKATEQGTPQGGIISPLLANVYLHELDTYMLKYNALNDVERRRRRIQGQANFFYVRYADDFVVMSNGKREQVEVMKEELKQFLKNELQLNLSDKKTKITHVNDGFEFLGIGIKRKVNTNGKKGTTLYIPKAALKSVSDKIKTATNPDTHHDSMSTKILALNRVINGWCRYYQYTSMTSKSFSKLNSILYWHMAHWLGRKYQISIPTVIRRFGRENTFHTENIRLVLPSSIKTKRWRKPCAKPNPYTEPDEMLERETRDKPTWIGTEDRPGMSDIRNQVLMRDAMTCHITGQRLTRVTAHVDHIKPYHKFKLSDNANRLENLQTLHVDVHKKKSRIEIQQRISTG